MIDLILLANCGYHSSSAVLANSGYSFEYSSFSHSIAVFKLIKVSQNLLSVEVGTFIILAPSFSAGSISYHSSFFISCNIFQNHFACCFSCRAVSINIFAICTYHSFFATLAYKS